MAKKKKNKGNNKQSVNTNKGNDNTGSSPVQPKRSLAQETPKQAPIDEVVNKEETLEQSPDITEQEQKVANLQALLKQAKGDLGKAKKRVVGSKKYETARSNATNQVKWALKKNEESIASTTRALAAIAKLEGEEERLGVKAEERLSVKLTEESAPLVD